MKKIFSFLILSFFFVLFFSVKFEVKAEMTATEDDPYTYYEDINYNQVSMGGLHSSVLTSEGRLFTWGFNNDGQLGDGTTITKSKLVEITDQFSLNTGETIIKVSMGYRHSSVITSEGRLFTWGSNLYGQLGDGTIASKSTPTDITGQFGLASGENIIQVSLGKYHSLAITSEGRIFTWGLNSIGQLGDGTSSTMSSNPIDITSQFGLAQGEIFTYVSLGDYISSAITSEGKLFAWGQNGSGQLGDGTESSKSVPTDITSQFNLNTEEKIIKSSYGYRHSFAITSEGRFFAWGENSYGQLGDGTTTSKSTPTEITSQFVLTVGESIIDFASSYDFSSATTSEGRLFTWGENGYGQLGDGTQTPYTPHSNPIEITNQLNLSTEETVIKVSLGYTHSSIITSKGKLFSWGYNDYGQLGDGTVTPQSSPIEIGYNILNINQNNLPIYQEIIQVSLGNSFSSAITSEGMLFTWGENSYGQLGDGTTISKSTPTEITSQFGLFPGETISQISLGDSFAIAITSEDRLFSWGYNGFGQLGDNTTTSKSTPTEITNQFNLSTGETVTQVSLGQYHSLAITSEGRIFSWGSNINGQLGDDTATFKLVPTDITSQFGLFPGETINHISSGESHSAAITSEGRLFIWGYNLYGQLGDGTRTA
ncbi:MAG: hypothetical protein K9L64_06955, partial [Candidatus Izimaplasma sp.]|nr:hypothetical protein [Candidatus Izimaplasma bacterium]